MIVRSGEERNCGKLLFVANNNPTIVLLVCWQFNLIVRKMACTGPPPDSAEIPNPAPPLPVEIITDSQPEAEEDDDDKRIFPNQHADIDKRTI